ncbi:unnamed protein product [Pleuronectes platessa]|uniref:RING-type E3 ubiquitin transferase n=1 Tax=Pleuronectes platessa TaxID=8262 RepID=A0A9N7YRB4_PLEPL|nr:unnamed protein product [Pleuronectes platessa]
MLADGTKQKNQIINIDHIWDLRRSSRQRRDCVTHAHKQAIHAGSQCRKSSAEPRSCFGSAVCYLCVLENINWREMSPVSKEEEGGGAGRPLSLDDCRCPVCLEIIIEPVTLPCTHTFCKVCFLETVDKSTLCCPMCRKRVSSWARLNSRKNTLVDQQLWNQIQSSFPLQCERRLKGQEDEDDPGVLVFAPSVSRPGEVRQEYEDQIMKLTEEKRVMEEEERRASDELIQRLLAEEEVELQEETRRREADEQLARLLNNQLNSSPVTQGNIPPAAVTPPTNRPKEVGSIDRFFSPLSSKTTSDCSSASKQPRQQGERGRLN